MCRIPGPAFLFSIALDTPTLHGAGRADSDPKKIGVNKTPNNRYFDEDNGLIQPAYSVWNRAQSYLSVLFRKCCAIDVRCRQFFTSKRLSEKVFSWVLLPFLLCCGSVSLWGIADVFAQEAAGGKAPAGEEVKEEKPSAVVCRRKVSYLWRPLAKAARPGSEPAPEEEQLLDVVEQVAPTEEEAKLILNAKSGVIERDALRECKTQHESKSECIRERLKRIERELNLLDFRSRKNITDSIEEECGSWLGRCVGAKLGEIECVPAPIGIAAPAAAEAASKGEGGKTGKAPEGKAAK